MSLKSNSIEDAILSIRQSGREDCGPTCLAMLCKFHGIKISAEKIRSSYICYPGLVSLQSLIEAARSIGFLAAGVKLTIDQLPNSTLPCILHWKKSHFVVLYRIMDQIYFVADPALGLMRYNKRQFISRWVLKSTPLCGIALILTPDVDVATQNSLQFK